MPFSQGFDPRAAERATRGRQRGARFRLLLILVVVLLGGAVAFERWLWGWRWGSGAVPREDVRETHAEPPAFALPPPPGVTQAAFAPPKPPPAAPQAGRHEPRLPTRIAFDARAEPPPMPWFQDGRRPMLAKGCALRPGATIIRAALLTTVQSEVAGQAIAQVSEDVYDVDGVGRLLIPAGTRVVGAYKVGGLDFQRRRLDFVWSEMTLPDGTQLDLGGAAGMDAAGSMGVGGEVRTRWGELVATAALLTVLDAAEVGTSRTAATGADVADALAQAAGREGGQLGREVTRKVLGWEPTILVPGGTPITISPQKTLQVC